ncbi:hypothetical protein UFOVP820_8 [uncultured Caudovirales phage]|uniref:Uncharacterized protein n=1 Tax=uncultured Caudovirales phage TaxID=2100421 RepID=A0A6J5P7N5_9CAUD|nr:hypothetical protein UFOVP820_8 [uncultured Caudovirales phage]
MESILEVIARLEEFVTRHSRSRNGDKPSRVERETSSNGHSIRAVATKNDTRMIQGWGGIRQVHYTVRWYLNGKAVSRANLIKAFDRAAAEGQE